LHIVGTSLRLPTGAHWVRLQLAAGDAHSLGLRSDGSVLGWGHNAHRQVRPRALSD
jgi:alpha-tubulin suppressor-like RCC1 family protein